MLLINNLKIKIDRWADGQSVRRIRFCTAGGHIVEAEQQVYGRGWIIQTNFSEFCEERKTEVEAYGTALRIAANIDANGFSAG